MGRTLIIAEAGVNHNGDVRVAKKMAEEAKRCGADVVKFQAFDPDRLASRHAGMAAYQKQNLGVEQTQREMLRALALQPQDYAALADFCRGVGIQFLSTPFDIGSIHLLDRLQGMWKVPSGEVTNYPYLVAVARTGKDVLLSTGMCTMDEVDRALAVLKGHGAGRVTLLHCTTDYPAPMQDVNLNAMLALKAHCGCPVGYSDHTDGMEVPVAAVALGAQVIEKHFTLDRAMEGPDHKASLEPGAFAAMARAIRNTEAALGDGRKGPTESEQANMLVVRKSIVAAAGIKEGEQFTEANLTTKRPGTGISPMRWNEVIGMRAKRSFCEDELIEL